MGNNIAPAPWKVERYDHSETGIVELFLADANGRRFATKIVMESSEKEQCAKTYALLAAAPDMYKMLNWLYNNFDNSTDPEMVEIAWQIEPILKNARGEE